MTAYLMVQRVRFDNREFRFERPLPAPAFTLPAVGMHLAVGLSQVVQVAGVVWSPIDNVVTLIGKQRDARPQADFGVEDLKAEYAAAGFVLAWDSDPADAEQPARPEHPEHKARIIRRTTP